MKKVQRLLALGALMMMVLTVMAQPLSSNAQKNSIMYIAYAATGKMTATEQGHVLSLNNPRFSYFTDRPAREAGQIGANYFVNSWSRGGDSFARVNPNAALIADYAVTGKSLVTREHFVILTSPTYDAKNNTLSFTTKSLTQSDTLQDGSLQQIVLFIDDSQCPNGPEGKGCW